VSISLVADSRRWLAPLAQSLPTPQWLPESMISVHSGEPQSSTSEADDFVGQ
jgi:hypothetical protein